jgi:hypothetical protein
MGWFCPWLDQDVRLLSPADTDPRKHQATPPPDPPSTPLPPPTTKKTGSDPTPMWSLSFHPTQRVAAYCGDAGILGLIPVEPPLVSRRHQKPAVALSALAVGDGEAWFLTAAQLTGNVGLHNGGSSHRRGAEEEPAARRGVLFDPRQILYCTAFSHNVVGGACYLAAGSAAGLVRVHRVMVSLDGGHEMEERFVL